MVQGDPTDLDLRRRLAAVHLSTGNQVEAGRWSYLAEDRDPDAVAAFERANMDPKARLQALRWPVDRLDEVPAPFRQTLRDLRDAPRRRGFRASPVTTSLGERVLDRVIDSAYVAFLLLNVAAWIAGYVALARWIW